MYFNNAPGSLVLIAKVFAVFCVTTVFKCLFWQVRMNLIQWKEKSQIQTTLGKLFLSQRYVVFQTLLFMPKAAWMIAKLSFHFIVLWESQNHRGYKTIKHILLWNTIPMKNSRTFFPFSFLLHKILLKSKTFDLGKKNSA